MYAMALMAALRAVKVGGKVVYATCSISPDENDGVIDRCLQAVKKEKWTIEIISDDALDSVAEKTSHGRLVLPDYPEDSEGHWGPLYFAVLRKT